MMLVFRLCCLASMLSMSLGTKEQHDGGKLDNLNRNGTAPNNSSLHRKELEFFLKIPSSICVAPTSTKVRLGKSNDSKHGEMLLDTKHRIIMDWSPKAACTKAVEMFWNEMGIIRGIYYPRNAFVHSYRYSFYKQCGHVTPQDWTSKSYFKFKIVRNPFNRAVSSYLHLMKTHIAHMILWKSLSIKGSVNKMENINKTENHLTFESFLGMYHREVRPVASSLHNLAISHFSPQASDEEVARFKAHKTSPFNRIVHLESFDRDIAIVNTLTKMNYSFPLGDDPHVVVKAEHPDVYHGNLTFYELMEAHGVPENYGTFYNKNTQALVQDIFSDDLLIYNYSFPFAKLY